MKQNRLRVPTRCLTDLLVVVSALFLAQVAASLPFDPLSFIWATINTPLHAEDFVKIPIWFLGTNLPLFILAELKCRDNAFSAQGRWILVIQVGSIGIFVPALLIFLLTVIPFKPTLFLYDFVFTFLFFGALHSCVHIVTRVSDEETQIKLSLVTILGFAWKVLTAPLSWFVLLLAVTCLGTAYLYKKSPIIHGAVNALRMKLLIDEQGQWVFEDMYPALRFEHPIQLRSHPLNSGQLFVLERRGVLYKVLTDSSVSKRIFLDISRQVHLNRYGENGALGFAFHPEFGRTDSPNQGYFYLYYTTLKNNHQYNLLSRFQITDHEEVVSAASETVLIEQLHHDAGLHNGGTVEFGPDGFLYLSIGDASGMGRDALGRSQKLDGRLFAGIFRMDVDKIGVKVSHEIRRQPRNGRTGNYFVPNDNPFVGRQEILEEYWALGLRNPYRFSFDSKTGELWVGDVGQDSYEEVNIASKGTNHQWSYMEGPDPFTESRFGGKKPDSLIGKETPPLFWYRHNAIDRCVIGGIVYRGSKYSELYGSYIFADNYSGQIWSLKKDRNGNYQREFLAVVDTSGVFGISSLGRDENGNVLITVLGNPKSRDGRVLFLRKGLSGSVNESMQFGNEEFRIGQSVSVDDKYAMHCARCHGIYGDASNSVAAALDPIPRDFTDRAWQQRVTNERIKKVIRDGGPSVGLDESMSGWGSAFSEEEIAALLRKIRSFDH